MKEHGLTCYIVFQTHWDREWYFPFEVFRHRLIQVIERVVDGLEKGELKQFVMDGQMAALEDYLEVCEEDAGERLKKRISEGKIIIGPWYILADEFLVCGESLIRNLEMGLKLAGKYGNPQMVGYLPDTFGHVSQMPQILQGFDIDNAILWRGIKPEKSEFYWEAPDGTRVFTIFLPEGYYQPILNEEDYKEKIQAFLDKVVPYASTSKVLLTNGGDHLMPKAGSMSEKIDELNSQLDPVFIESNYEEYLQAVRGEVNEELNTHTGEMRENEHCYILPNVLSTRTYLKQQNQWMEDELTGYAEPLLALAGKNPKRYLEETWKLLLKNQPYDSICGCSVDEVHREMENRTMKLGQRMELLQNEALMALGAFDSSVSGSGLRKPFEDDGRFLVFNPHPYPYTGWVKGIVWLQEGSREHFALRSSAGEIYEPIILSKEKRRFFESPLDAFPEFREGIFYELAFYAENLPGLSLSEFTVIEGVNLVLQEEETASIENKHLTLTLEQDGTLTMIDKKANVAYKGLQQLYSSLDAGDEYNYSRPLKDIVSYAVLSENPSVKKAEGVQILNYKLELELPAGLNAERHGPADQVVKTTLSMEVKLFKNMTRVEVTVKVENGAKDQRLRVKFPLSATIPYTYSDTSFDIVRREAKKKEVLDAPKQREVPVVVEPSYSFIRAGDKRKGIVFFQRGLQEYQITSDGIGDVLEVTLLRSVGWLSRDDLRSRGGGAGPMLETPDAQCLGSYEFTYAFGPSKPELTNMEITKEAREFRVPAKIFSGKLREDTGALIEIDNDTLQWSSIRTTDDGLLIRLWNPSEISQQVSFSSIRGIDQVTRVTLGGKQLSEIKGLRDSISPKRVSTYRIQFTEGGGKG
jgi:alpha-mannosidase/mannosylglycerate hydrolase